MWTGCKPFVRSFALVPAEVSPSGEGASATGVAGIGYLLEAKSRMMPAQRWSQPSSDDSAAKVNHLGPNGPKAVRPISLRILSLVRFVDSKFRGNPLWT